MIQPSVSDADAAEKFPAHVKHTVSEGVLTYCSLPLCMHTCILVSAGSIVFCAMTCRIVNQLPSGKGYLRTTADPSL